MRTSDKAQQIPELFREGKDVYEIADILGYKSPGYIRTVLREQNMLPEQKYGIDVPKVLALRKAGWHMDRIIDEFGHNYTSKQIMKAVDEWDAERKKKSEKNQTGR